MQPAGAPGAEAMKRKFPSGEWSQPADTSDPSQFAKRRRVDPMGASPAPSAGSLQGAAQASSTPHFDSRDSASTGPVNPVVMPQGSYPVPGNPFMWEGPQLPRPPPGWAYVPEHALRHPPNLPPNIPPGHHMSSFYVGPTPGAPIPMPPQGSTRGSAQGYLPVANSNPSFQPTHPASQPPMTTSKSQIMHDKLGLSKSPVLEALIYCALNQWGIKFEYRDKGNADDISFRVLDIDFFLEQVAVINSKNRPTNDLGARVKSLRRWFDGIPKVKNQRSEFVMTLKKERAKLDKMTMLVQKVTKIYDERLRLSRQSEQQQQQQQHQQQQQQMPNKMMHVTPAAARRPSQSQPITQPPGDVVPASPNPSPEYSQYPGSGSTPGSDLKWNQVKFEGGDGHAKPGMVPSVPVASPYPNYAAPSPGLMTLQPPLTPDFPGE
eukprot:TRINITY_DN876_c0_g5_i1.p1 TRINITY_DN876_c0_g5~~TRINITY_DN876_c0_g5_i1.p1  ORF type:complete len:434 (-),score=70.25 TRINITY_DN876_c0_g5_i1:31-1332(-)